MNRVHRSLVRRAKKIDPDETANRGEDYLYGLKINRKFLKGVPGLKTELSIKNHIKKIDQLDREIEKLEDKIERLEERRALEAAKLEEKINHNLDIARDYLTAGEFRDFVR